MSLALPVVRDGFSFSGDTFSAIASGNIHRRATLPELQAHFRASTASADDHPAHWYEAQLIHYGLPPSRVKGTAKMRLQDAVRAGLKVPAAMVALEAAMKKEWVAANKGSGGGGSSNAKGKTKVSPGKKETKSKTTEEEKPKATKEKETKEKETKPKEVKEPKAKAGSKRKADSSNNSDNANFAVMGASGMTINLSLSFGDPVAQPAAKKARTTTSVAAKSKTTTAKTAIPKTATTKTATTKATITKATITEATITKTKTKPGAAKPKALPKGLTALGEEYDSIKHETAPPARKKQTARRGGSFQSTSTRAPVNCGEFEDGHGGGDGYDYDEYGDNPFDNGNYGYGYSRDDYGDEEVERGPPPPYYI